jgi:hypothetical protein
LQGPFRPLALPPSEILPHLNKLPDQGPLREFSERITLESGTKGGFIWQTLMYMEAKNRLRCRPEKVTNGMRTPQLQILVNLKKLLEKKKKWKEVLNNPLPQKDLLNAQALQAQAQKDLQNHALLANLTNTVVA